MELSKMETLWEPIITRHPDSKQNSQQYGGSNGHFGFVEYQESWEKYELKGFFIRGVL